MIANFNSPSQNISTETAKLLNPDLVHLPLILHEAMPTFAFPFLPQKRSVVSSTNFALITH